jgi:hypothetical protein
VVDLVLQDPRVPTRRVDRDRGAAVVERLDTGGAGARDDRLQPLDAEAALEGLDDLGAECERGFTITWNGTGARAVSSSSTLSSITARASGSPIWGAARPTPGASRMVSRMSSINC